MKVLIICGLICLVAANAATLPERLNLTICKKSDVDYEKCLRDAFETSRTHFVNGIPELNFPGIDPLIIDYTTVNRTLNDLVSIQATLKNVRVTGLGDVIIDNVKADLENMIGEIHLTIPHIEMSMEHDVSGQLLIIPLRSRGYFRGNFTDIQMYMRAQFVKYVQDGVEYFSVDKFDFKSRVGNGVVKIIAKNPALQFTADLITNFYNENPRLVMDAINPIYIDYSNTVIKQEINNYLAKVPASEFLPE